MQSSDARRAKTSEDGSRQAADLNWLAFLITGQRDVSIDIAADTVTAQYGGGSLFNDWMRAWSRRIVITKALAAVRVELQESVRRTRLGRLKSPPALGEWSLGPHATKAEIEEALLAIDIFPRTVVVLCLFEGIRIADAAIVLDADTTLVRKAQAIGVRQLVTNLAHGSGDGVPRLAPRLKLALA